MMTKEEVAEMRAAMKARAQERAVEAEPLIHGMFMAASLMSGKSPGDALKAADAGMAKWSDKWIDGPAGQA
jgi:hypothetical protein